MTAFINQSTIYIYINIPKLFPKNISSYLLSLLHATDCKNQNPSSNISIANPIQITVYKTVITSDWSFVFTNKCIRSASDFVTHNVCDCLWKEIILRTSIYITGFQEAPLFFHGLFQFTAFHSSPSVSFS